MKKAYWLLAALPLAVAACATDETPETDLPEVGTMEAPTTTTMPGEDMGGMASTVSMEALGDADVSGEAIVTPAGEETQLSVTLNGLAPNAAHPGHIHQGSCESVGSVVTPLSDITADASGSGTMTTTVPLPSNDVMNGEHIVVYHDAGGTPIVCGDIEAHMM